MAPLKLYKNLCFVGCRGRCPLQMPILRITNVGANCVSPAKNYVIDTLKGAIKGSFSFNMPFPMNSGRQKSAGIQPPKTASGQDLKR